MISKMKGDELIEHYNLYLTDFNAKNLKGIKFHLSPECFVVYNGKIVSKDREEMLPNYIKHWTESSRVRSVEILEIKPIKCGVWTLLRSWDERKDVEVEYYFNEEGKHVKHLIKSVTEIKNKES